MTEPRPSIFEASHITHFLNSYVSAVKKYFGSERLKTWSQDLGINSRITFKKYIKGKTPIPSLIIEKMREGLDLSKSEIVEFDQKLNMNTSAEPRSSVKDFVVSSEFFDSPINTMILNLCGIQTPMNLQKIQDIFNGVYEFEEIERSIKKLIELSLIQENFDGRLIRIFEGNLTTLPGQKSTASKNYFKESYRLADMAWEFPLAIREVGAFTFRLSSEDIPEMKQLIRNFRKDMSALGKKNNSNSVYQCSIAAFPIYLEQQA